MVQEENLEGPRDDHGSEQNFTKRTEDNGPEKMPLIQDKLNSIGEYCSFNKVSNQYFPN